MELSLVENLVFRDGDGRPMTTSLIVAEKFGKRHDNVLRDIDRLQQKRKEASLNALNFEVVDYVDAKGEKRPMVKMDREAFTHLAWSFTGIEAAIWQDRFYRAFEAVERALTSGVVAQAKHLEIAQNLLELSQRALAQSSFVYERLPAVEQNIQQHDERIESLEEFRDRVRPTLERKQFTDAIKQIYRLVVIKFYRGLCPCCQQTEIISSSGAVLPIARYEHWTERNRNWPTDGWIVCHHCNKMLEKERQKHSAKFGLFHERLEQLQGPADQLPIRGL